jgi:hypothetical protein
MGMSEAEFYQTTPRFFLLKQEGWAESHLQQGWEIARYIAFFTISPHTKKGALKTVSDLGKFPWEVEQKEEWTPEQMSALKEQMKTDWENFINECKALEN